MNNVSLTGRLTKDPELRYTPAGIAVTTFTLACDRPFNTNGKKEADFIQIVTWRKTAEVAANFLRKGLKTGVTGRIQTRNYENNEGRRIYVFEVVADNVEFLEKSQVTAEEPYPNNEYPPANPFDDDRPIEIPDDWVPF